VIVQRKRAQFFPASQCWRTGVCRTAEVEGDEVTKRAAFRDAFLLLSRRIDLLLALPLEQLERLAVEARVRGISESGAA